ncbi:MAG: DUF975 family protein [Clostridiales bacterium]|nr:DUF975 family protein [Clostridiales bacterium]
MTVKDIKSEARQKLPINLHQAIIVYLIEYVVFVTLGVLILTAGLLAAESGHVASAVLIFLYGVVMLTLVSVFAGVISFAMSDFYLASYRCMPYNIRRLADVVSRNGIGKIITMNLIRAVLGFLLLLCLIVPGVIYLTRTSMANYLLNANPNMKPSTALKASGKVMSGKMGKYIGMTFSMFGWILIGVITLGIGFIFVMPYINMVKASYYKRILAGDRGVYTIPVQPVSPIPEAAQQVQMQQMQMQAQQMQAQQMRAQQMHAAQQTPPMQHQVPPIEALPEDDVADMNQAIIDFGGEPVGAAAVDIPEVPITPPTRSVQDDASDPVSDLFVETVKPLSTEEVDASHVYDRQVDAMFSGDPAAPEPSAQDYMSEQGPQSANDFVTQEVEAEEDEPVISEVPEGDGEPVQSVMSDEDFAAFIRAFDVPTPEAKFTPLKQRKTGKTIDNPDIPPTEPPISETQNVETLIAEQPPEEPEPDTPPVEPTASERPSARPSMERPSARPSVDRPSARPNIERPTPARPSVDRPSARPSVERPSVTARPSVTPRSSASSTAVDREQARREREERLKNLRRK